MAGRPPGGGRSQRRRLSRSAEFERVYRQGRSKANRFLVLYAFPRPEDAPPSSAASRRGASPSADGSAESSVAEPATPAAVNGSEQRAAAGERAPDEPAVPTEPAAPVPDPGGPRLGLSVSRRVGGAVERARVKRVLREAFWAEAPRLPAGSDYVVVARPDSLGLAERDGMTGMREALAELVDSLGGTRGSADA
jgi:ribonuclease P protein component